ncbi:MULTISPECIES: PIN domain-containing protein [Dolichospermum]|uniref:PIN domain-containing protein n=1 Tax=Dolichospermum TaxID=748770 RepID=UPI00048060B8|nr:PIN domain-containing protein [Dolichospermum circinale]MBD1213485.1 DUF4935 domain-containing protein [Dolichospermum circinale Clear-D4]MBD2441816.1 DUF4935 domain-containing protein [Dolichospermum sp. FACHB-1091]MDB9481275.1 PIN domain-containing protein [Dolichospermum circinale CS-537/05]MDB9456005.1 PIN domain-containing protein [Dolichospermum circinale CS-541/06]MDB9461382.1 PIN domain-containing protein [Dolichospermum circinale CS-541/04]
MIILYIETNFLMAVAKGQDLKAVDLLQDIPSSIRIVIPDICYIESLTTYKIDKRKRLDFQEEMDKQIKELNRDKTSDYARLFMGNLGEARINNELLINDIQDRLFTTIDQLLNNSELINLNKSLIQNIAETTIFQTEAWLVKNDIMDNIILQSILDHAQLYPQEDKAFISNNSKDFGKPEVQYALRNAGIRYFTITQHFLDWFNSRSLT